MCRHKAILELERAIASVEQRVRGATGGRADGAGRGPRGPQQGRGPGHRGQAHHRAGRRRWHPRGGDRVLGDSGALVDSFSTATMGAPRSPAPQPRAPLRHRDQRRSHAGRNGYESSRGQGIQPRTQII